MLHLQNLKFLFQFFFLLSSTKHTLYLVNVKFHVFQIFGKKNPPFMQKPDMVADIFQFAQIVRRDYRSKFPVHDLRCKQALYRLTHYRIKAIKGLIAKQIFRCRAHTDDYQNLFFHTFGKSCNSAIFFQMKLFHQFMEKPGSKLRVKVPVKAHQIHCCIICRKITVI